MLLILINSYLHVFMMAVYKMDLLKLRSCLQLFDFGFHLHKVFLPSKICEAVKYF